LYQEAIILFLKEDGLQVDSFVKENDSISQKMNYMEHPLISWSFKDTEGGTKVTWQSKGNMSFLFKFYTALNGS
jgi:hypothetical protein